MNKIGLNCENLLKIIVLNIKLSIFKILIIFLNN